MHNPSQATMLAPSEDTPGVYSRAWERLTPEDWSHLQIIGLAVAHRLTTDPGLAEDLASEAILRLGQRLSAGATVDAPVSYLSATVRHLAADHYRHQQWVCLTLDTSDGPDDLVRWAAHVNQGSTADPTAATVDLLELVATLPPRQGKALIYRALGYTNLEIAGVLGLGRPGTVAVLIYRARRKLKQSLTADTPQAPLPRKPRQQG